MAGRDTPYMAVRKKLNIWPDVQLQPCQTDLGKVQLKERQMSKGRRQVCGGGVRCVVRGVRCVWGRGQVCGGGVRCVGEGSGVGVGSGVLGGSGV